jgi:glycosidase
MNKEFNNLIIYQVMVSAFQDGDNRVGYETGYGPSSFKGDLKGVKNALPYIKELNVNMIWLTPIFDSDGHSKLDSTGYFARNYYKIDPKFGSFEDAKDLVNEAHKLGIYVILDGVFGHHKSDVFPSPKGIKPEGSDGLVLFPQSLEFYKNVATWWIDELEIDGWRFDQSYQLSTPNQDKNYWQDIRKEVERKCDERRNEGKEWGILGYMVGEDWSGNPNDIAKRTYGDDNYPGLHSAFAFPLRYNLVQVLATQEDINTSYAYNRPAYVLNDGLRNQSIYPNHAIPNLMIGNHDLVRFGDLIQRAPHLGYGKENDDYWKRHKIAFSFLAAYTGPITIYYGEEIGDEVKEFVYQGDQGLSDDHVSRSNGQIYELTPKQKDLKDYVAVLMNMRKENKSLWNGKRTNIIASETIFSDLKEETENRVLYIMNTSTSKEEVAINRDKLSAYRLEDLISNDVIECFEYNFKIQIDGLSARFLKLK